MEYYYEFQNWLSKTNVYQDILQELPVPLNNIHFDSVVIIGIGVYVVYRVADGVCYGIYRRHIRRKQEKERKLQWEREKEMISRELQVKQKEENLGRFLTYLERTAVRGKNRSTGYEVQNIQGQKQGWVGQRVLRLEVNDEVLSDSRASEYDAVMDAFAFDAEQSLEIKQKRSVEKEQMFNRMSELDDVLRVREVKEEDETMVGHVEDVAIEKRKERARRLAEKERLKAEKKHQHEEKKQMRKRKRQKGVADGSNDK